MADTPAKHPVHPSAVTRAATPAVPVDESSADLTREELQQRVDEARESITHTVAQIKDTVEEHVDAVKGTVSGVLTMSEQFQREPVAWSLGALSAGFAMGYSLGRAHHAKNTRGRPSHLARMADDVASELASFGSALVSPELSAELRQTFGVDLTAALARIAALQTRPRPRPRKSPSRKTAPRKTARAHTRPSAQRRSTSPTRKRK